MIGGGHNPLLHRQDCSSVLRACRYRTTCRYMKPNVVIKSISLLLGTLCKKFVIR